MTSRSSSVPSEADELFASRPDEFVAARDELAKRLRADGRRSESDAVKALRSPTLAAWAANQLARRQAADVERLVRAGADYRGTQKRDALAEERAALDDLVGAARELLHEIGRRPSQSVLERVRATLQAAATDDEAAAELRAGRLARELEPSALETLLAAGAAARKRSPTRPKAQPAVDRRAAREELRKARGDERDARRAVERAQAELERAQRSLDDARQRLAEAESRVGRA